MYIETNNEKIIFNFNPYPSLTIEGDEDLYYVELREYVNNQLTPRILESYPISPTLNNLWHKYFECFVEFYCDFEFSVFKFVDGYGIQRIFTHRFCENGKNIKFNLHSLDEQDCNLWVDTIKEYQKKKSCYVSLNSNFDNLNSQFEIDSKDNSIEFYKTYNIGRFPKTSTDFRTTDERMEGFVWLANSKKFWSYQHPRFWGPLNSQEIVNDILGMN
jgi:hypothetical protein